VKELMLTPEEIEDAMNNAEAIFRQTHPHSDPDDSAILQWQSIAQAQLAKVLAALEPQHKAEVEKARKEGMKEVVEWIEKELLNVNYPAWYVSSQDGKKWQAFLKAKGIEVEP
jgi:hypothetical protein